MSPQWIVVIVLIAVVYFIFIKKRPQVKQNKKGSTNKNTEEEEVQTNDMIECAECGIYCEIDDAILSNNKYYCSQECLKKS